MNPTSRTSIFVAVAVVSFGLAFSANQFTKPAKLSQEYEKFGTEFFPDFTDPSKATALRVVSFDESLAASKEFTVVNKDGWRIKSHNDYPADGKDQLAKVAASIISLKRGAIVSHREADHEHYGVIDPLDEKNTSFKGRGSRITLLEKGEIALADFIIGNKVEGSEDKRYIRKEGEKTVYMVSAKFDISTKFADWAETDLLKVGGFDIVNLKGTRPKFNADEELEGLEVVELNREKSDAPWKLVGADETIEELKTEEVTGMVSTLDDLKLVGVRVKPSLAGKPILSADLKLSLPAELRSNPEIIQQAQSVLISSLREKGFVVAKDDEGNRQIASKEGELIASTKDGVVYRMTFGSAFSGSEEDLEIGRNEETKPDAPKATSDEKKDDKGDGSQPPAKTNEVKGRYIFVRAEFDEKLLGPKPVEPVKPEPPPGVEPIDEAKPADKKPAEDGDQKKSEEKRSDKEPDVKKEAAAEEKKDEEKKCGDDEAKQDEAKKSDNKAAAESKDEKKSEAKEKEADKKPESPAKPTEDKSADDKLKETKPAADGPKVDLKAQYQEALRKYDGDKGRFAAETAAYEAKVEAGKKKVKELNDRFADWYYVISNESFDKLRLNRSELVKKKIPVDANDKKPEVDAAKPADAPATSEPKSEEPTKKPDAGKPTDEKAKPESDDKAKDDK